MFNKAIFALFLFYLPAFATVRNVQTCGATGNGTTDDTAAINSCIALLVNGDTLLFPAGTYKVTSALTRIAVNNVTIDGSSSTATVKGFTAGQTIFQIGGAIGTGSSTNLTATANELSQTIAANFAGIGASAGSYILIEQGPTGASGQRGEVLQLASSAGTSAIVTTMLHDTFSTTTANEVANVRLLNTPVSGITMQNIILDGDSHTAGNGLNVTNLVNSTFSGVTIQNFTGLGGCAFNGAAFTECYTFGVTKSNITITGIGNNGAGSTFQSGYNSIYTGNDTINTMSITSGNGGGSQGLFGFAHSEGANLYVSGLTVDATTNGVGRPFKIDDCRYCTFLNATVQNQPSVALGDNAFTYEYFSAHVLCNTCIATGIAGNTSFGFNLYGDDNGQNEGNVSFNTFYNSTCSVTSPATYCFGVHTDDVNNSILGGTYSGVAGNHVIDTTIGGNTTAANFYVSGAAVNTPGNIGIDSGGTNACINNNTFTGSFASGFAIFVASGSAIGAGNSLGGNSSNLTSGGCPGTTGANGSGALASIGPSSLSFGGQTINTTSNPLGITVTNGIGIFKGTSMLSFVSAKLTTGTQFAISGCTSPVAPGASCSFTVTFTPTSAGVKTDTLTLYDNAGGAAQTVSLSGFGGNGTAPNYQSTTSTANPGTVSALFTGTVGVNQTAYDTSYNPSPLDPYTRVTDSTTFGGKSAGNGTCSGGSNDVMWSVNSDFLSVVASGQAYTLNLSNTGQVLNTGNLLTQGAQFTCPISWSHVTDNVVYSSANITQVKKNTLTLPFNGTVASTTTVVDFSTACPQFAGLTGWSWSGILGVSNNDNRFNLSLSNVGGQGTGVWQAVYDASLHQCASMNQGGGPDWQANTNYYFGVTGQKGTITPGTNNPGRYGFEALSTGVSGGTYPASWCQTVGCTQTDNTVTWVNTGVPGQYYAFGATSPSGTLATSNTCTNGTNCNCWGAQSHDSQFSGNGLYSVISLTGTGGFGACSGVGGGIIWQVGTATTIFETGAVTGPVVHMGGHNSIGTADSLNAESANVSSIRPLSNTLSYTQFFGGTTWSTHGGWPQPDAGDDYPWIHTSYALLASGQDTGCGTPAACPINAGNTIAAIFPGNPSAYPPGQPRVLFGHTFSCNDSSTPICFVPTGANWSAGIVYVTTTTPPNIPTIITPLSGNAGGYSYQVSVAGTGAGSAPTWCQTAGCSVTDGGATLINIGVAGASAYDTGSFGASEGIISVSQDGNWVALVSGMLRGLGLDSSGLSRADYFVVHIGAPTGATPTAATPTLSPAAGSYTAPLTVTCSTTSPRAIICDNLTGSPATNHGSGCAAGSTLFTGGITLNSSSTVYCVAGGTGYLDSGIGSAAYTINQQAATPVFSPAGGIFPSTSPPLVTISTPIGSQIWYNTTGSPTCGGGTQYTTPITVSSTETLYAVACGTGFTTSPVGSAAFVIVPPSGFSFQIQGTAKVSGTAVIQ